MSPVPFAGEPNGHETFNKSAFKLAASTMLHVDVVERDGHSAVSKPAWNTAGMVYITIVTIYTALLIFGLHVLWHHRKSPAVKIRGFRITLSGVISIHAYVLALFIVYPLNGAFTCNTEFWYMSIVFPTGIALFAACNARMWQYSVDQHAMLELKRLTEPPSSFKFSPRGLRTWFGNLNLLKKTYCCIFLGMVVQLMITLFVFYGSRRFNASTGFFGEETDPLTCRRGWEWLPSVAWQFVWNWIYGPVVLFKTRNIKDVHYWALQTRLSVLAGLPGTPLWLAFLYASSPDLFMIGQWWPPAMWFAPGLIMMQLTSIVFPILDLRRMKNLNRPFSVASTLSYGSTVSSLRKSREVAVSKDAFTYQVKHDISPLLEFSTRKDFTSENILFLRDARNFYLKWRALSAPAADPEGRVGGRFLRAMFEAAAIIYFELVCPSTARFPINLDSSMYHELAETFKSLAYIPAQTPREREIGNSSTDSMMSGSTFRNVVAPWDEPQAPAELHIPSSATQGSSSSETGLIDIGMEQGSAIELVSLPRPALTAAEPPQHGTYHRSIRFADHDRARRPKHRLLKLHLPNFRLPDILARNVPRGSPYNRPNTPPMGAKGQVVSRNSGNERADPNFVPGSFRHEVFDKAYDHIHQLVYLNTWKSFIHTLEEDGLDKLVGLNAPNLIPSRGLQGQPGSRMSHLTDVERNDMDLQTQAGRDEPTTSHTHLFVLEEEPSQDDAVEEVDDRCRVCGNKPLPQNTNIVRNARYRTEYYCFECVPAENDYWSVTLAQNDSVTALTSQPREEFEFV